MLSLQCSLKPLALKEALISSPSAMLLQRIRPFSLPASLLGKRCRNIAPFSARSSQEIPESSSRPGILSTGSDICKSPLSVQDALMGFISGTRKATEVAHSVWQNIIHKGDIVVDATCGNGHDTLALLKMVADESGKGCVYGMDIQISALENTSSLLDDSISPKEFRLVAFNLGYLPGGDKAIITKSRTTLPALEAASRILESGGLLSTIVYVGHPGGREEFETVRDFASSLPPATWVCSKFEFLNRPSSPVLVLLFKK